MERNEVKKMVDYISREAAIKALGEEPIVWSNDNDYELGERNQWRLDKSAIEATSSADVVEVVLCKDCVWHDGVESCVRQVCACFHENDFCSYGERREDGEIH